MWSPREIISHSAGVTGKGGGGITSTHESAGPNPLHALSDSCSKHPTTASGDEVQDTMVNSVATNREDMLPVSPTLTSEAQEPVFSSAVSNGEEDQQPQPSTALADMVAEDTVNLSEDEGDNDQSEVAHLLVLTPLPLQASVVVEAATNLSLRLDVCSPTRVSSPAPPPAQGMSRKTDVTLEPLRGNSCDNTSAHCIEQVWMPAEDVLPLNPAEATPDENSQAQPPVNVYTRRTKAQTISSPEPTPQLEMEALFLNRTSKWLPITLPTPSIPRRRRQVAALTQVPHRSHHIAKLSPDSNRQAAATVCHRIGFMEGQQTLTKSAQKKYIAFFDKPINREHVVALASLLGKEVPQDTQQQQEETMLVV
jgi:hypothetical protein